jgi:type VI secretion system protein ImpJ
MVAELKTAPTQNLSRNDSAAGLPPLSKPNWAQGLKLTGQHFQAQDRYHEDLVRFAMRMAFDQPWGVSQLVLDEENVAAGQIHVRRLDAILPDGTPILAGGVEGTVIPPRSFERHLRGRPSLDVYAALPTEVTGSPMVGTSSSDGRHRYIQEEATVANYNTGRNPLRVPWARPNPRLVFEDESLDGSTAIRIARLLATEGRARLDPHFVPPVLRVQASPSLQVSLRAIEKCALAAKAVVGEVRATGADMTGSDAARLLLATTLGRFLPALQGLLTSEGAHPRDAYRVVAALVGSVSAFAPAGATQIPSFDYLDLRATFGALEARARELLDSLSGPTHKAIAMSRYDDNVSHGQLREQGIFGKEFLLVVAGADPASLHANVPRAAKVAAWEEIGDVVQRHLAGVPLLPELRRPHGLDLPPLAACFRLDKRAPAWASIVKHGSISVYLPAGYTQLQASLIAQERGVFA